LLYSLSVAVPGRDFVAGVRVQARALMRAEDDQWWMSGIELGGVSDYGATPMQAYVAFKACLNEALTEVAQDAEGYEAFCADAENLFRDKNVLYEQRWLAARAAIRDGSIDPGPAFADLPRERGEPRVDIRVQLIATLEAARCADELLALADVA
jgi:hypothetical protein